jgi:hypothetical protein
MFKIHEQKQECQNNAKNNFNNVPSQDTIEEWTSTELNICTQIAEKYPKNYYAWTHRRFVIDTLLQLIKIQDVNVSTSIKDYTWEILESEFNMISSLWITKHVSDHSAIHYGGEILRILVSFKKSSINGDDRSHEWIMKQLTKVLNESQMLILKHPSNEVIWIWRRICSQIYIDILLEKDMLDAEKFVQIEVQLFLSRGDKSIEMLLKDEYDGRRNSLHRKTYILWLIKNLQRLPRSDSQIDHIADIKPELIELQSTLIQDLVSENGGSALSFSNFWSLK